MKKSFIILLVTGCFVCTAGKVTAQQAGPEKKPQVAPLKQTSSTSETPQALAAQKAADEGGTAKPIIPGGEFKPMDTRVNLPSSTVASKPVTASLPVNRPVPAAKTEEKKPASTPAQQ